MKKLFIPVLCFCLTTGGLLFAQASRDELKVKFSGYADFHGIYIENPDTGYGNNMEGRIRPYFNFAKGDVSADLKLEIDPIMGKDTATGGSNTRYFDFGADQTNVIEVKNAFLQMKSVFSRIDFKGGVFGYAIPGRIMIADDVPRFELISQIGRFSVDACMLKFREGNIGTGRTDVFYFTLWGLADTAVPFSKERPGGNLKIQPIFTVAAASEFDDVAYIPQIYLETKYGAVSANLVGAYAFGSDKTGASDVRYSSFWGETRVEDRLQTAVCKGFRHSLHRRRLRG